MGEERREAGNEKVREMSRGEEIGRPTEVEGEEREEDREYEEEER